MSASFAYEDPLLRPAAQTTTQKAREIFKEMGRGMWSSGRAITLFYLSEIKLSLFFSVLDTLFYMA